MKNLMLRRLAVVVIIGAGIFLLRRIAPNHPHADTATPQRQTAGHAVPGDIAQPATPRLQVFKDADLAPAWTVKFGQEFWRRPVGVAEHENSSVVNPPFSLGDVMRRVEHALTPDPDTGSATVIAGGYTASFNGRELRFSPDHPAPDSLNNNSAEEPAIEPAPPRAVGYPTSDPMTEISFRTESVQRDGNYFFSANRDGADWCVIGNTAQNLLAPDWGIVEHYETEKDGVAVTWVFPKPLPGTGPVEIAASVDGLTYAGETESGQHFADNSGVARVRIGLAYAVDALGNRWELTTRPAPYNNGMVEVELPAAIQSEAVYPLAVDPIIGPEFGMDQPVSSPATGDQVTPAIAGGSGIFLVAWADNRNAAGTGTDIYGARVSSSGKILDPLGIAISTAAANQTVPAVAVNGTTFLVVWQDLRLGNNVIFGARVSNTGGVLDPHGIAMSASTAGEINPAVAGGPPGFLVVWEDDRNLASTGRDIYGTRVNTAGVVLDPAGLAISTNATDQITPTVAAGPGGFFAAWQDNRNVGTTGQDIYGARVSSAGVVLDPTGVPISTANANQSEPAIAFNGPVALVAWRDRRTSGSTSDDIYGARVDLSGNAVTVLDTNGIAISTNPASQRTPAVCALTNQYLVVWRDRRNLGTTGDDIYGARVDANGILQDTNGIVISNDPATQTTPAVASIPSGAFVVWADSRNAADTGNDIYGARVSNLGAVLDTNGLAVSLSGAAESAPAVAFNGTNYLVVWQDERHFQTNSSDILGARVSGVGAVLDLHGINICVQPGTQQNPSVAASGGEFLVAWADSRNAATTGVDIYGTRVDGSGNVLDPAGLPISTEPNDEATPVVAGNQNTFLVAWADNRNGPTAPDLYATLVSQAGVVSNPTGLPISTTGANEENPTIAASSNLFLIAWDDTADVFAARVTTGGVVLDPSGFALQLANQGSETFPSVAALGTNFLVAWMDGRNAAVTGSDIYAGRVFADATIPDFNGIPVCTLPQQQINPVVGATGDTWLIVWQNQGPAGFDDDLYSARVSAAGVVQDFLSVPLLGTGDRVAPRLAYGGAGKFLLVSQGFRQNSQRIAANLMTSEPPLANAFIQFSVAAYATLESAKLAKVTVTLTGKYSGAATVDFATVDGTALAGVDYMPVADRIVFCNKKTSSVIVIPLIDDGVVESNKTVTLTLQNPTGGAWLGPRHTATLTILE